MQKYFAIISLVIICSFAIFPSFVLAAPSCAGSPDPNQLCNPFESNSGSKKISSFAQFAIFVLNVFSGLAGIVSIVYIVFSGFRFITSQGNEETVESAKRGLQWSVIGFVVILLSYIIVLGISKELKFQGLGTPDQLKNPLTLNTFFDLYTRLLDAFFSIMALIAILMLIVSGYRYITAQGNTEQAEAAKKTITYAVLGIVVALLAYVIVHSVATFFGLP